jgi:hypothetical protein
MMPNNALQADPTKGTAERNVFAPLWKDYLTRLRATDPDLFEGREASATAR